MYISSYNFFKKKIIWSNDCPYGRGIKKTSPIFFCCVGQKEKEEIVEVAVGVNSGGQKWWQFFMKDVKGLLGRVERC